LPTTEVMLIGPWVQQLLIRRPFLRNLLHKLFSGNEALFNQQFASASVCARLETRSSSIVTGLLSGSAIVLPSLDHLVCAKKQRLRNRDANLLCRREIHHQLILGWLFNGKFSWFGAVQDLTCKHTNASEQFSKAWAISQKAPRFGKSTLPENRWQPTVDCKVCDLFLVPQKKDGWEYYETVSTIFRRAYKRFVNLVATSHFQDFQPDFQSSGRILRRYQRLSPGDRRPEDP